MTAFAVSTIRVVRMLSLSTSTETGITRGSWREVLSKTSTMEHGA